MTNLMNGSENWYDGLSPVRLSRQHGRDGEMDLDCWSIDLERVLWKSTVPGNCGDLFPPAGKVKCVGLRSGSRDPAPAFSARRIQRGAEKAGFPTHPRRFSATRVYPEEEKLIPEPQRRSGKAPTTQGDPYQVSLSIALECKFDIVTWLAAIRDR